MFPNEGLSMEQMAYACHAIGLDTVYTSLLDDGRRRPIADGQAHELLVNTVYAYLRGGVPLALGMCLFDEKRSEEEDQYIGSHVVAVTGYRVGDSIRAFSDEEPFLTKASAIDMLFVHDDQVGPFAPMSFEHDPTTFGAVILGNGADTLPSLTLTTGWGDDAGNPGSVVAIPDNLLVALYHKIRIQYRTIHEGIRLFDAILRDLSCPIAPLVWDIYLTSVGDVKRELLQEAPALSSEIRWNVLTKPMPRFIWRATASSGDKNVVDLFFDATGIEQDSLLVCCPLEYQTTVGDFIRSLLSDPTEAAALDQQFSSEWRSRPGRFAQKLLAGFMPLQNETSDACCPHTCGA
jgi:hypothetical protein